MIKNILIFALIIGCIAFGGESLRAQLDDKDMEGIDHLVVAELFTSQSCSSCPPADKILAQIAENQNVIALGFHVTYWDHLHWKDTLGQDLASERQRNYAAYRKDGRVYTPQMILNGEQQFVGNDADRLLRTLKKTNEVAAINLSAEGKAIKVLIPDLPMNTSNSVSFWLYGIKKTHTQDIPSGENKGRTVTYTNAVMHEREYSRTGALREFEFENPNWSDIDALVLIAQRNRFGEIIAAGITPVSY